MSEKGQIFKILIMFGVVCLLVAGLLWKEGINPVSRQAAEIVGEQVCEAIYSSNENLEEVSRKTSEQVTDATESVSGSSSGTVSKEEKETAKTSNKEVKKTDASIAQWVEDKVMSISQLLPAWLPGRPYVVMVTGLAVLMVLIVVINKKMK